MKEEALELANDIDECPYFTSFGKEKVGDIIRKLVAELDKQRQHNLLMGALEKSSTKIERLQTKPLSDDEINAIDNFVKHSELALSHNEYMNKFARAIELKHGIK